jgi:hypothetical protein
MLSGAAVAALLLCLLSVAGRAAADLAIGPSVAAAAGVPPGQAKKADPGADVPPGQAKKVDPAAGDPAAGLPPGQAKKIDGAPADPAAADAGAGLPPGQAKKLDPAPADPAPATPAPPADPGTGTPAATPPLPGAPSTDPIAASVPGAAPPVLGRSMAVKPAEGTVAVRLPGGEGFISLTAAGSVPSGSIVDARRGVVTLRTALDAPGATQTATIWGAVFEVRQSRSARGMTDLVLRAKPEGCSRRAGAARAAAVAGRSGKPAEGLWVKDRNGRFRTRGRNSVAIVRGTRWLTKETCAGTLTRVTEGSVAVRDLRSGLTVTLEAGDSHLARSR